MTNMAPLSVLTRLALISPLRHVRVLMLAIFLIFFLALFIKSNATIAMIPPATTAYIPSLSPPFFTQ